jgi:hypothetical protein
MCGTRVNLGDAVRQTYIWCGDLASYCSQELHMKIQVNTDDNIKGDELLSQRVETEIMSRLGRFSEHITRIEVHLSDENAAKGGANDKRCLIEVRLEGRKPEAVRESAATLEAAYSGAARKLGRLLESSLGRLQHKKGAESLRDDKTPMVDPRSID